jgi:hypothetical protein
MAIAPVLKTGVRKDLGVRIPRPPLAFVGLIVAMLQAHAVRAQTVERELRGVAIDSRTTAPIRDGEFAATSGRDTIGRARSDSVGRFRLSVRTATTVVLHVRKIGYRPDSISVDSGDDHIVRIALDPGIATLASVVVKDSAFNGFQQRAQRSTGGHFIRLADIERQHPLRTTDLFRTIPGLALSDSAGVLRVISQRNVRRTMPSSGRLVVGGDTAHVPASDAERCAIRVALDGHLTDTGFSVDDVRPADIVAIEVYVGAATIPIEFSSVRHGAPCGLIMIWTKLGRDR